MWGFVYTSVATSGLRELYTWSAQPWMFQQVWFYMSSDLWAEGAVHLISSALNVSEGGDIMRSCTSVQMLTWWWPLHLNFYQCYPQGSNFPHVIQWCKPFTVCWEVNYGKLENGWSNIGRVTSWLHQSALDSLINEVSLLSGIFFFIVVQDLVVQLLQHLLVHTPHSFSSSSDAWNILQECFNSIV